MYRVLKRPKVTAFYDDIGRFMFDVENERLEQEYAAMLKKGTGTFPKVLDASTGPDGQNVEVIEETAGDTENIPDQEADMISADCREEPVKITVQDLLEQKRRELDKWLGAMEEDFNTDDNFAAPGITQLRIIVQALELLAGQQDSQEGPETGNEMPEQPPLPALKNNEQRKEWLRKYQEWGLWYEDGNIGAKYYRYCFENGAELIVEEYHSEYAGDYTASYFHLVGGPEAPRKNGIPRWQRNGRYNKFPNSETELAEFLKFVQKGDQ